jgi:hypothetical protein
VNVPERQPCCRTSSIAEKIKPAEFEKVVRQLSKNESFLPVHGLPLAESGDWRQSFSTMRKFRFVAAVSTGRGVAASAPSKAG